LRIDVAHGSARKTYFNSLLGAALSVLISHAFALVGRSDLEPFGFLSHGQTDLDGTATYILFFISGLLVAQSLVRSQSLARYGRNRALRIFPALIVVVILAAVVLGPAVTTWPLTRYFADERFRSYLAGAVLMGGDPLPGVFEGDPAGSAVNGSLWTLPYEVVCYASLAAIGAAGLLTKRRIVLAATLILIVLGWWAKNKHWYLVAPFNIEFPYILRFFGYFSAGVAFFVFRDRIILDGRLAVAAFALSAKFFMFGLYHMFFPILGGYVITFLGMNKRLGLNFFQSRDYSYGIYIYAFPLQQLMILLAPGARLWWANILLSLPPTILFAVLSWHLVEKPALALKRRVKVLSSPIPAPKIS
jgi:peptidoglycan/LPS O-acetylase OafA/YrhL